MKAKDKEKEKNPIKVIGVVGAGTMGAGIAQVAAQSGFNVILHDLREELLERGRQSIGASLKRDVEKGRLGEEGEQKILERIRTTIELDALREADFLIEAASENLEL